MWFPGVRGAALWAKRGHHLPIVALLVCCAAPEAWAQLRMRVYASGFNTPVAFVQDPTDRTVQLVVEKGGRVRVVRNGSVLPADFLNLTQEVSTGSEQGLLGLAFAPDYATSGRFFVNFTNLNGHTVVARFRRSANPLVADAASRFDLRWTGEGPAFIDQPFTNHNGGHLAFGPDGYLYVGLGDGGSGNDPDHRAQDPRELLGKMLRIDVSVPDADVIGYRVPSDNPFLGSSLPGVRPEIWAFGLRNPWRYNFDDPAHGGTGALIIGDVGQGNWEEVDYEPAGRGGRNYGWRNREGAHDRVTSLPPAFLPLIDPIHEYNHTNGASITGGFVYRGGRLGAAYQGRYFFADFSFGRVWSLALNVNPVTGEAAASTPSQLTEHSAELWGAGPAQNVSSFGVDADGELYLVSFSDGQILAIVSAGVAPAITRHPLSAVRAPGVRASFTASASGDPSPSVQWQVSTNGGQSWTNIAGATATTYSLVATPADNGKAFRAVFNNSLGSTPTAAATLTVRRTVPSDLDGDGQADLVVWRANTGTWYWLTSQSGYSIGSALAKQWGSESAGDVPSMSDIDGDGVADLIVWRASTGTWYWLTSSTGYSYAAARAKQWGIAGDIPLTGDLDGDGRTDLIVWRASTGTWYWLTSSSGYEYAAAGAVQWGNQGLGDIPLVGDVDGDGLGDLVVWRASTGTWYWLTSESGYNYAAAGAKPWGSQSAGDVACLGDLDGDGLADLVVWRASTGTWYWLPSSSSYAYVSAAAKQWGSASAGDVPLLADLDADGRADLTVWRATTGEWYWLTSSSGYSYTQARVKQWGSHSAGDIPMVK